MEGSRPTGDIEDEVKAGVKRVRRRDLLDLVIAGVAAFVLATAINIPVSALLASGNAHTNCVLIGELAKLGADRVASEKAEAAQFKRESKDRLGLSPAAFDALVKRQQTETAHRQVVTERIAHHACG